MVHIPKPVFWLGLGFPGETLLCFADIIHTSTECSLMFRLCSLKFLSNPCGPSPVCWPFSNSDYYDRSDALPPLQPQLVQPVAGPLVRASHVHCLIRCAGG